MHEPHQNNSKAPTPCAGMCAAWAKAAALARPSTFASFPNVQRCGASRSEACKAANLVCIVGTPASTPHAPRCASYGPQTCARMHGADVWCLGVPRTQRLRAGAPKRGPHSGRGGVQPLLCPPGPQHGRGATSTGSAHALPTRAPGQCAAAGAQCRPQGVASEGARARYPACPRLRAAAPAAACRHMRAPARCSCCGWQERNPCCWGLCATTGQLGLLSSALHCGCSSRCRIHPGPSCSQAAGSQAHCCCWPRCCCGD